MTGWIKIDNSMPSHPKVLMVGDRASWLHVCGVCYSNEHLTDGFIARHVLAVVAPGVKFPDRLAAQLVAAGLWHETDEGWRIHDYAEHQSPASEIRERRQRDADRKAAARASAKSPRGQIADSSGTASDCLTGVLVQEEEEKKKRKEEKPATQAARKRARVTVDQTKRPDNFPDHLGEIGKQVIVILRRIWEVRGGVEPQARNVGLGIMRNERADHVAVARELEQYMTTGKGEHVRCADIALRYGDRVQGAPASARQSLSAPARPDTQDFGRFDRAAKAKREAREQQRRDEQLGDAA